MNLISGEFHKFLIISLFGDVSRFQTFFRKVLAAHLLAWLILLLVGSGLSLLAGSGGGWLASTQPAFFAFLDRTLLVLVAINLSVFLLVIYPSSVNYNIVKHGNYGLSAWETIGCVVYGYMAVQVWQLIVL